MIRAELYPLYGGYWGYRAAPWRDVQEQTLVLKARKKAEAADRANTQSDIDAQASALEAQQQRTMRR